MKQVFFIGIVLLLFTIQCSDEPEAEQIYLVTEPFSGPEIGFAERYTTVPNEALPESISNTDNIVGNGTPESCDCEALQKAIELGGTITFNCGDTPHIINITNTLKVKNDANPDIIIDGEGKIALNGMGKRRILYMNTCDQDQVWTTSHCQNQDHPRLTVQNLIFYNGNSKAETEYDGGGAIWVRGGRFKAVNCAFYNNICAETGPDVGGGAIRVFSQYEGMPVYINACTFGGAEGYGNSGSNGGALSSIGVSWSIYNSLFSYNTCTGNGGNPSQENTPGGGSGGAI